MNNSFQFLLSGCSTLALIACGDDVTKMTNVTNETTGMEVTVTADSLGTCDSAALGKMVFASDENAIYVCADSGWASLSKSAADGKDGKNGLDGASGTSCTVAALADSSGYKIVCGDDSVGVVLNGKNGSDGTDGKDGKDNEEGCSLAEDRDGIVKFVCGKADTVTLYKALCGSESYDPAKRFCFADSAYDLCGSKSYDPAKEFCASDSAYALCGGKSYNPLEKFCFADSIWDSIDSSLVSAAVSASCPALHFVTTEYLNQKMLADRQYGFLLDERDCQVYRAVTIGSQTWMAQNLNYASVDGNMDYKKGSFCYDDIEENCDTYGKIYSWTASADMPSSYSTSKFVSEKRNEEKYQGACPAGYHIPQYEEVVTLLTYAGGVASSNNVGKLSAAFLWSDNLWSNSTTKTDAYGLSLLPGGWLTDLGKYRYEKIGTRFWLALDTKHTGAYIWGRDAGAYKFDFNINYQHYKFSIRCIKD